MWKKKTLSSLRALVVAALVAVPFSSVILPFTALAAATDYYVSTTGNNANTGTTPGTAWRTIGHAGSVVTAGTTGGAIVHVAPGVYTEFGLILSNSGTAANPIKYVSDTKWGAKIQHPTPAPAPAATPDPFVATVKNNGDYVTIDGFEITSPSSCFGINNQGGNTSMINNHVHHVGTTAGCGGNGGAGIVNGDTTYTKGNTDIIGNYVHDIGSWPTAQSSVQCIYHSLDGGRIMNNISFHCAGFGIHLWHAARNTVVSNNTTFNNASGGIIFGAGDSPYPNTVVIADNIVIANNIVANNAGNGITEYGYGTGAQIGPNNKIQNNIVYNNTGTSISTMKAQAVNVKNNNFNNPEFVNYTGDTNGDYHLKAISPGRDSGTNLGSPIWAPSYDYDYKQRPAGANYDIGALEYNMLPNSSFEMGSASPTGWSTATANGGIVAWDTAEHQNGAKSIKVVGAGGTSTAPSVARYLLTNRAPVIAGKSYTLSGYYKSSGIGTANYTFLKITWYNSASAYISGYDAYANIPAGSQAAWTLTSVTATAPVGAVTALVEAQSYQNTGTAWFDSVALLEN